MTVPLPLQDVHPGIAPGWWPPAPGWWILAGLILIVVVVVSGWRLRTRRRQAALQRLFDETVDRAEAPSQQVAAISELLRRAARCVDPAADRLEGDAWLTFLDQGLPDQPFTTGAGVLLRDGGFRPTAAADEVDALRIVSRRRYLSWMQRK